MSSYVCHDALYKPCSLIVNFFFPMYGFEGFWGQKDDQSCLIEFEWQGFQSFPILKPTRLFLLTCLCISNVNRSVCIYGYFVHGLRDCLKKMLFQYYCIIMTF
ncbi:hypothetical protein NE237_018425 [Protea cynaroides]|uniref:Uncharacterized protein n=1 Tax=Protea cynaroides TaxID=273540 RepID=A0A9Q0KA08_9MAGN|nr:hypothetical protein NE237_018425 [Protea cynaroides]